MYMSGFYTRPREDAPTCCVVAPILDKHRRTLSSEEREAMIHDPDLMQRVNIPRSTVPATTHVDYSARIQTIDERHGRYQRLMKRFYEKTGCPIIVDTSFNLSWEPIVRSPPQAYHTFMQSEMDVLVLEDFVLHKAEQPVRVKFWAEPRSAVLPTRTARGPTQILASRWW